MPDMGGAGRAPLFALQANRARWKVGLFAGIAVSALALGFGIDSRFSTHGGSGHMTTLVSHAQRVTKYLGAMAETRSCRLEFLRYEPSKWEASWRAQAAFLQEKACPTMIEQTPLVDKWMAAMKPSFAAGVSAAALPGMESSEVFSHFVSRDTCTGVEMRLPIEPLVGVLRHPTAASACRPEGSTALLAPEHDITIADDHIQNKGYMVVQPLGQELTAKLYPGRKFLFDLGTGRFLSGSLPWFIRTFEAKGIVFDEIYGWEVTSIPPAEYWNEFPANISQKMHFRNVPCSVEPNDPRNPLNMVRRIYRPGDYIAFKLDIDNEPIEQALMKQLDPGVTDKIAEFFFEQHFDIAEMRSNFGTGLTTKLPEVLQLFHEVRNTGLRLHYWP